MAVSKQVQDMLNWGKTQIGKPYVTDLRYRFGPNGYDCSGFVTACAQHVGVRLPASNSADIARICRDMGLLISYDKALETPGCVLLMGPNRAYDGYGPTGHILFVSADTGLTLESSGSRGVNQRPITTFNWPYLFATKQANAALLPGIDYSTPEVDWAALAKILAQMEIDMTEGGLAVDMVFNPNDPKSGYVLDRFGGIHPFGNAKPFPSGTIGYWPGSDVARKLFISDWNKPWGYTLDLWGAVHPAGGAPALRGTPWFKGFPNARPV